MSEIKGSSQQDLLTGEFANDTILGLADEDALLGLELDDWIAGNTDNDFLNGNAGSDTVRGGKGNDTIHGGKENDLLYGDLGSDLVYGDSGNDTIIGGNGSNNTLQDSIEEDQSDFLFGNAGNDYINGNVGDDTVDGGDGNDTLHGGKNNDQLFGNLGDDKVWGDLGNDTALGEEGNDQLVGGKGEDYLNGNEGSDWVAGNEGEDTVHGGQGDDTIHGGKDNDLLFGDKGNDLLIGDLGSDTLNGGEGNDTFVIGRRNDVAGYRTTGGMNLTDADWILDFGTGTDKIQLIGGITFDDLNIFAGTGEYAGYTIIQDKTLGEYLAILKGFTGTLSRQDFISSTPTPPTSPNEDDPGTPPPGGEENPPPTSSSPNNILLSNVTVDENSPGGTIIGNLSASDPDAEDTHTYALLDNAGGRFIIDGNVLKVAPGASLDFETQASHSIKVRVTDAAGNIFDKVFTINLQNTNDAPTTANPILDQNGTAGTAFNFTFNANTFNDPDGDLLTYTATLADGKALPTWLTFNPATRTFSGTPTNGDVSNLSITVQASDGKGGIVTDTFNLVINNVNVDDFITVANPIADLTTPEDSVFNFTFAETTFNDPDGDILTYTATLVNGAPLPAWLTFNPSTRTFSGTPTNEDVGTLAITVQASDGKGSVATDTFNLVIDNVNDEPTVANPIADLNTPEDSAFNFTFAANTFTDPDGDSLTYTAKLTNGSTLPAWLTFNPVTRTFSGTPTNKDVGTLSIDVEASDGKGGRVVDTFNLVIGNVNNPPIVANPIAALNTPENKVFNFTFAANTFTDPDGDSLTYSATLNGGAPLPAWLTFNPATRTFSGTPTDGDVGILSIDIKASDGNGGSVINTFNLEIDNIDPNNKPPVVVNPIADLNTLEDAGFNFTVAGTTFNDADGDPLTYTAKLTNGAILPAWLTFNPVTRTFSGTPTNGDVGTLSIDVEASDGKGGRVIDTFNLVIGNVNDNPTVVNPIARLNTLEDATFNFTFNANTFNDIDGDPLTYTATLKGGAPLPAWLTFNPATRTFSGTPTNGDVGTLSIDVTASDGNGGTVTNTFDLVIDNVNDDPTIVTAIADQKANAGTAFNFTFNANTFNDIDGDPLTYTAKLNNGAALPAWLKFNPVTRTFSGTPTNGDVGTLSIAVQASDGKGGSVIDTFNLNIGDIPPTNKPPILLNPISDRNTPEDAAFNFTFAPNTFSDPDGDALTYTATLVGGGALPAWLTFNPATRTFSGTPTNGDVGTLSIAIQASDGKGGSVIDTFNLNIDDIPPTNKPPTVVNPIADLNTNENSAFNFTFAATTFNDPDGDVLTYTATLADGKALPAWLTFNPTTRTFSGTPTYDDAGSLVINVQASDGKGGSATDTFNLNIGDVNRPPILVNPITQQNTLEDALFNFTFSPNTFTDPDGDILTYTATLADGKALPAWLTFNPTNRTFSGTPTHDNVGTLSINVRASDGKGGSVNNTFNLVVNNTNDPPTLINPVSDLNTNKNTLFKFTFDVNTFNDIDGDLLTYSATLSNGTPLPAWLTFNSETRTFSGTPTSNDVGTLSINVQASDGNGGTATDTFNLVISNNPPIVVNPIANQNTLEDATYNFTFDANTFTDPDGDALTYTATLASGSALPAWLTFNPATRTFSGTPTNDHVGTLAINVQASDTNGGSVIESFDLVINNTNDAPTVVPPIADQTVNEDSPLTFNISSNFNDVDGDTLTYTATLASGESLPAWLTFNSATGIFIGTPTNDDVGTLSINVQASDGNGGSVTDTFDLVINNTNDAPTVVNPILDQTATQDVAFNFTVDANTFNDVDGDELTYTATLANGGALPAWLTFNPETRTFNGTPTNDDVGTLSIDVQVSDGNGGSVTDTFDLVINNVNDNPIVANPIADLNTDEDSVFNFTFAANTFTDPDSDALTYTATLMGGEPLPAWLTFNPQTRTFSGTPTNDDVGSLSINIQASDGNGGSVTDTFNLVINNTNDAPTVVNPILDQTATQDVAFNFIVNASTFNDVDGDELTYTATLTGSTVLPAWLTFDTATRTFSGTPTNNDVGTLSIDVQASDGNGGSVVETFNLVINNVNDDPIIANPIADLTTDEDSVFNFTFAETTFEDPDGDELTYTATLANGAALPAWLTFNPATRTFSGTPTNDHVGTLAINVQASDTNGGSVIESFELVINNTNDAPTVVPPIADQTVNEDSPLTFNISSNFNDVDGDTLTYTATLASGESLPAWLTFNSATGIFSGTPTNDDVGTLSINVQASDGNGGSVTDTFNLIINNTNDAPTVANPIPDQNASQNTPFNFTFEVDTFNDIEGDALTYTATLANGGALPAWLTFNAATRTFSGTPTNANVGSLSINVQASDGNGGSVIDNFNLVINNVNDPPNVVTPIADQTVDEDSPFNLNISSNFNDIDGDPLTYTASLASGAALPAWLTFDSATGTFSGTPTNANVGSLVINVQASDGNGGDTTDTFNLVVNNTNDAPIVTNPIPNLNTPEDSAFNFTFAANTFTDPDSDPLTYIATLTGNAPLPAWLTFNPATRTFSGTPTNGDVGTLSIDVQASDGNGGSVTDTFSLVVTNTNDAPTVVNPIANQNANAGTPFNFTFPTTTFQDIDGDVLTYTATQANGTALPAWLTFNPATRTFSGTPTNANVGTLSINLLASDGNGGSVAETFNLTIGVDNNLPVAVDDTITRPVLLRSRLEIPVATLLANDTDPDVPADTLTITEVSAANGTASISNGIITFRANPGFAGPTTLNYTLSDGRGGTDTGTVTFNVATQIQLSTIATGTNVPTGTGGFSINGQAAFEWAGFSVSQAGDVNGDGFADVIIGAPYASPTAPQSGKSYVVFGGPAGSNGGFVINGQADGDRSGWSVSGAGDVNGDGLADLIIGADRADANGLSSGRSYVVFGKANNTPVNLAAVAANPGTGGFVINGQSIGTRSGASVSVAGDINGDGLDDLIVGAPDFGIDADGNGTLDRNETVGSGRTYVVFGKANNTTPVNLNAVANGTGGFAITFQTTGDQAGISVSGAGDVNGDGLDDLIMGAHWADPNGNYAGGRAYVVYGRTTTTTVNLGTVAGGTGGFVINGQATNDRLGRSVNAAGDVNGDGYADVIVGAYNADPNQTSPGRAYVVFGGPSGTTGGFTINGETAGDQAGISVSSAGDVNGDGLDDLIVGARWADPNGAYSGKSYVVFGKANNTAVNLSAVAAGIGGFALNGAAANNLAGRSVSGAGDLNGDGFADIIVGAFGATPNGANSGTSYVVYGGDFTASVTQMGTAAADILTGTAAADILVGGLGNDQLIGNGGADVLYGGAGDDILAISNTNFRRIDGGLGTDTLRLDGAGINLDLTAIPDALIRGIERINITGAGNNTLSVGATDLISLSDTTNTLTVLGNAGDVVNASGFTAAGIANGFTQYTGSGATLLVQVGVTVNVLL